MKYLVAVLLGFVCLAASAGIDKIAAPTDSGFKLMWWPKVDPPKGWHFDQGSSYYFSFNAMAPDGWTFSKTETVMYAQAEYKPRVPQSSTLAAYMDNDMASFTKEEPDISVVSGQAVRSLSGQSFQIVSYHPARGSSGNWERVAYGEEGEYYLTFVISSRSQKGFEAAMPAFMSMLENYREGP